MAGTGFETTAFSSGNTPLSETGDAKSDVNCTQSDDADPDLMAVVNAWPTLPESLKAGIVAVVRAAGKGE